jgi:hypothetical protein
MAGVFHGLPHIDAIVAMERITLDPGGLDCLTDENAFERGSDSGGSGSG